ncbi:hypothetical protein TNCV_3616411 [Trichonephila clavipes]|nr:hypothetical protein TNCV_3616411 [Trichonephila clavipes]
MKNLEGVKMHECEARLNDCVIGLICPSGIIVHHPSCDTRISTRDNFHLSVLDCSGIALAIALSPAAHSGQFSQSGARKLQK